MVEVTFFVACYNEEENIVTTLETLRDAVAEIGCSSETIIIDDASTDCSVRLIHDFMKRHPQLSIILKRNRTNHGLAGNFVEAASRGTGRYYKLICGDNVESRERLVRILRPRKDADMILPWHRHCEGRSLLRSALSRAYTILVNLASGYSLRYYNGLPLFLREHVLRWPPRTTGFGFQAELVTRLLEEGVSYREVLCDARDRTAGTSQALTLKNFLSVARTLLDISGRRISKKFSREPRTSVSIPDATHLHS